MVERLKWNLEETMPARNGASMPAGEIDGIDIAALLSPGALGVWFQPIFSAVTGGVYGYEALARVERDSGLDIGRLFQRARETGQSAALDMVCRQNALHRAQQVGLGESCHLFINICPEVLMDTRHHMGVTEEIMAACGLTKDRIVLEVTEETAVTDYDLFCRAVEYYRKQGFRIAIDDFGVGYGGLKMLASIEPDFVKIDRHFIANIDRAIIRRNLVDSIATVCHRIGIQVIAEGVEEQSDLSVVMDLGIELLQGYLLARPAPHLLSADAKAVLPGKKRTPADFGERAFIGEVSRRVEPVPPHTAMPEIRVLFMDHPEVMSLPVVDGERVIGMLHRKRFFEEQLQGRFGFGQALSAYKCAGELIESSPFLLVEANTTLEDVAQKIPARGSEAIYDDICVASNGKYLGTVAISALLGAVTEKSLLLARGTNPLSGLPGNEAIQREIEKRIAQNMHFDVFYIDLDHFKPFNDCYGFEKGDAVLKMLACIIQEALDESTANGFGFAGHIGGDDFIVISRPQISIAVAESIIAKMTAHLQHVHGEDFEAGFYMATNRRGESEQFPLLALSIGIVSTEVHNVASYAQLSSLASEVKKAAKSRDGSSIVRDRRVNNEQNQIAEIRFVSPDFPTTNAPR